MEKLSQDLQKFINVCFVITAICFIALVGCNFLADTDIARIENVKSNWFKQVKIETNGQSVEGLIYTGPGQFIIQKQSKLPEAGNPSPVGSAPTE